MIQVTINNRKVQIEKGTTLLEASRLAGVHIPTLCYYPRLPSHAVCRICLVDVSSAARPQPACKTLAKDGDEVITDTVKLLDFRKADMEWLLARHPNNCMQCEVNGDCQFQSLVNEYQLEDKWPKLARGSIDHPEHKLTDHTSPSIWQDLSKCIECGLCAEACGKNGQQQHSIGFAEQSSERIPVTVFDKPLAQTNCISCGQCTLVCPVGALIEKPDWHDVLHTLDHHRRISAVQVAPATRVAIGEEFGMPAGTVSTGRMINALRALGFDYVFDTNFAADLTIMEEGSELLNRLKENRNLPLLTSCCPGWINWVEINRPDLIAHLSTTKSPQQMHGALTKRSLFTQALGEDFANGKAEPYVVSVMPCTAKKDEALRPGSSEDIDHVLTTRELARMIKARNISFNALPEEAEFDNPLGESTGAAQIFGASGGVMEAVVRTAAYFLNKENDLPIDWQPLRGVEQIIKTVEVQGVGKLAICNGIAAAEELFACDSWKEEFVAIEVMACKGGCLGGGGEPKSMDPDILQKRMQAIYSIDKTATRRRSYENTDVQKLYTNELHSPNSQQAEKLLHTTYASRHSKRLLLMQLLDAVDRRDAKQVSELFSEDGSWKTASPFGEVQGREAILTFITNQLPARQYGANFKRHRMATRADINDLTVITPHGETCRFSIETIEKSEGNISKTLIKSLSREIL